MADCACFVPKQPHLAHARGLHRIVEFNTHPRRGDETRQNRATAPGAPDNSKFDFVEALCRKPAARHSKDAIRQCSKRIHRVLCVHYQPIAGFHIVGPDAVDGSCVLREPLERARFFSATRWRGRGGSLVRLMREAHAVIVSKGQATSQPLLKTLRGARYRNALHAIRSEGATVSIGGASRRRHCRDDRELSGARVAEVPSCSPAPSAGCCWESRSPICGVRRPSDFKAWTCWISAALLERSAASQQVGSLCHPRSAAALRRDVTTSARCSSSVDAASQERHATRCITE